MPELTLLEADLVFHTEAEGGRQPLPRGALNSQQYRPHIIIGDTRRRGLVDRETVAREEYIGIAFVAGPDVVVPGELCVVRMALIYWPGYDYPTVTPGKGFTVREGARIVAHGQLKRRWVENVERAG